MRDSRLKPLFGVLLLLLVAIFCTPSNAVDDKQEETKSPDVEGLESFIEGTNGNMTFYKMEINADGRWELGIYIFSFRGLGDVLLDELHSLSSLDVEGVSLGIQIPAISGSEFIPFLEGLNLKDGIKLGISLTGDSFELPLAERFPKLPSSLDSLDVSDVAFLTLPPENMFEGSIPNSIRIVNSWFSARKRKDGELEGDQIDIDIEYFTPLWFKINPEVVVRVNSYLVMDAIVAWLNKNPMLNSLDVSLNGTAKSDLSGLKFIDSLRLRVQEGHALEHYPLLPTNSSDEDGKLYLENREVQLASPLAVREMIQELSTFEQMFYFSSFQTYSFHSSMDLDGEACDTDQGFRELPAHCVEWRVTPSIGWIVAIGEEFKEFRILVEWLNQIPGIVHMDAEAKFIRNAGVHLSDSLFIQDLFIHGRDDSGPWQMEYFPENLKRLKMGPSRNGKDFDAPWEVSRLPSSLEMLRIQKTPLRGTLPKLPPNMTSVFVSDNVNLSITVDKSWCKLRGLEKIEVESNKYDSSKNRVPSCIWKLPKLERARFCLNEDEFVSMVELGEMCDSSVVTAGFCDEGNDHCPPSNLGLVVVVWLVIVLATVWLLWCVFLGYIRISLGPIQETEEEARKRAEDARAFHGFLQGVLYVINIGLYGFMGVVLRHNLFGWLLAAGIVVHFLIGFYFWRLEIGRLRGKPSIGGLGDDGNEVAMAGASTDFTNIGLISGVLVDKSTLFDRVFFGWPADESGAPIRIAKAVAVDLPGMLLVEVLSVVACVTCTKLVRVSGSFDFKSYFRLRFRSLVFFLGPLAALLLSISYSSRVSDWVLPWDKLLLFMALPAFSTVLCIVILVAEKCYVGKYEDRVESAVVRSAFVMLLTKAYLARVRTDFRE